MGEIARNNSLSFFPLPNAWRYGAALAVATALIAAPGLAAAQDCSSVAAQQRQIEAHMLKLIADYPAANIIIGMCWSGASNDYSKSHDSSAAAASFGACALIGCAIAGGGQCTNVMSEWVTNAFRYEALKRQAEALGCEQ